MRWFIKWWLICMGLFLIYWSATWGWTLAQMPWFWVLLLGFIATRVIRRVIRGPKPKLTEADLVRHRKAYELGRRHGHTLFIEPQERETLRKMGGK